MKKLLLTACIMCLVALCSMPAYAQSNLRGDTNQDSSVSIKDVTTLINYLTTGDESAIGLDVADVNKDGSVNIKDVTALISYLMEGSWPYEPQIETFTVSGVTFEMLLVEGGTFMMGGRDFDPYVKPWELPAHEVTLSDYYIGVTEVTQELWKAVMGSNPSWFKYSYDSDYAYTDDLSRPVENMTYANCVSFLTKLEQKTGKTFRLLTDAEWEFAARGGNYSKGYMYPGSDDIDEVAWHTGNSSLYLPNADRYENMPHPVGTKAPNELGIYDMGGNVAEWCSDWFGYFTAEPQTNPTGPTSGQFRVVRGGSWGQSWRMNRVSYRYDVDPVNKNVNTGLRLALVM